MPFANNQQNSRELFFNRKEYVNFSYSQTIDTFKDEKLLVGKIDLKQNPIIPKETRLKIIQNIFEENRNITALDFVSDAFNDMVRRFKQNLSENKIIFRKNNQGNFEDPLTDLKCKKGYTNFLEDYSFYITGIFFRHLEFLKGNEFEQRKILNFRDFVTHFYNFININNIEFLMPSEYYRSYNNDRSTSGLILDFGSGDCSNDEYKFKLYHSNPNYPYFNRLANAFGFYIDKHVPWRLVADINSPQMKYYIMQRNLFLTNINSFNTSTVLSLYYEKYSNDYEEYMKYLTKSYNNLVNFRRNVKYFIEGKCNIYSATTTRYEVPEINLFNRLSLLTHQEIIRTYIHIKNHNTRLNYSTIELDKIYKYSISSFNNDKVKSLNYIDNKFNNINHLEGTITYNNIKDSYMLNGTDRNPVTDIANYIKVRKLKES